MDDDAVFERIGAFNREEEAWEEDDAFLQIMQELRDELRGEELARVLRRREEEAAWRAVKRMGALFVATFAWATVSMTGNPHTLFRVLWFVGQASLTVCLILC